MGDKVEEERQGQGGRREAGLHNGHGGGLPVCHVLLATPKRADQSEFRYILVMWHSTRERVRRRTRTHVGTVTMLGNTCDNGDFQKKIYERIIGFLHEVKKKSVCRLFV